MYHCHDIDREVHPGYDLDSNRVSSKVYFAILAGRKDMPHQSGDGSDSNYESGWARLIPSILQEGQ
jgi:hypothetical protein